MKRIFTILTTVTLLLCLLFSFTSCGNKAEEISRLEDAIAEYNDEIKSLEYDIKKYSEKYSECASLYLDVKSAGIDNYEEEREKLAGYMSQYKIWIAEAEKELENAKERKSELMDKLNALK